MAKQVKSRASNMLILASLVRGGEESPGQKGKKTPMEREKSSLAKRDSLRVCSEMSLRLTQAATMSLQHKELLNVCVFICK